MAVLIDHSWPPKGSTSRTPGALSLVVLVDGHPVGVQEVEADDFAIQRQVASEPWLGMRYQGNGIGTEMRAAMLHLAFAGLGRKRRSPPATCTYPLR